MTDLSDVQALTDRGEFTLDPRLDLKLRAGYIRDLNTLASHAFIDWDVSGELFGRHRLGLEPNHPLF